MLHYVLKAQWKYPTKDDWTTQVQADLKELKINMTLEQMKIKSQYSFKRLVMIKAKEQVGAELCQAQAHVGLPPEAELILSFMEVPSIFSKLF